MKRKQREAPPVTATGEEIRRAILRRRETMDDFVRHSCAAAPAFGWTADDFLDAFDRKSVEMYFAALQREADAR